MDKVKQHFEDEAQEFDRIIQTLIPDYSRMLSALVSAIPFDSDAPIKVVDLGCGTGTVAHAVLSAFPQSHLTCIDLAENMIAMSRSKLAAYPQTRFIVGDYSAFDRKYDVVVSSLALHHLASDSDKRRFYGRIHDNLLPGGVFYNADVVLASNNFLQTIYMREWRAFMQRSISDEEIDRVWIPKYSDEDHPARLVDQLYWLTEIGFTDVDVIWKRYNFAVYGGAKR